MTIGIDDPPDPFMVPPRAQPLSENEIRARLGNLERRVRSLAMVASWTSAFVLAWLATEMLENWGASFGTAHSVGTAVFIVSGGVLYFRLIDGLHPHP